MSRSNYYNVGSYEGDTTYVIGKSVRSHKNNISKTFIIPGRNSSLKNITSRKEGCYKYESQAFDPSNPSANAFITENGVRVYPSTYPGKRNFYPSPYGDGYRSEDAYGSGCNTHPGFMDGRPYDKRYHPATLGTRSSPTYVGDWGVRSSSLTNSYPYPPQSVNRWCGGSF